MTAEAVIQRANAFMPEKYGVRVDPDPVRLVKVRGRQKLLTWWLMDPARMFHPDITADGGVVDGGEVIVQVDDATGQAAVWPHP